METLNINSRYAKLLASNEGFKNKTASFQSVPILLDKIEKAYINRSNSMIFNPELFDLITSIFPQEKKLTNCINNSVFQIDNRYSIICDFGLIPFAINVQKIELLDPNKYKMEIEHVNDSILLKIDIHSDSLFEFIDMLPVNQRSKLILTRKIVDIVTTKHFQNSHRLNTLAKLAAIMREIELFSQTNPDPFNFNRLNLN